MKLTPNSFEIKSKGWLFGEGFKKLNQTAFLEHLHFGEWSQIKSESTNFIALYGVFTSDDLGV